MAIAPPEPSDAVKHQKVLSQSTLSKSENDQPIGRVLAPVRSTNLSQTPSPRDSSGYSVEDFPMEANEVESDIEVHFDITGNSSTEGRISDMQSCFRSRLSQIREMMLSGGVLPRRPMRNSEAWRNRRRYNSKDYEITIVGLASDVKWARTGSLMFVLEDETTQIGCVLKPPSDASPLHASLDGLMDDEIVGVSGFFTSGDRDPRLIVLDIHKPPLSNHSKAQATHDQAVSAAFLSDVHFGSKTFLQPQWDKMIHWFKNDPLARTVKYFVLSGDGVDGVGIYPGQERHLTVKDPVSYTHLRAHETDS